MLDKAKKEDYSSFLKECNEHLSKVFGAKEVSENLIDQIFEEQFIRAQSEGWLQVKMTVSKKVDDFSYYVEVLKDFISELRK